MKRPFSNITNERNFEGNCTLISQPAGTPKILRA